MKKKMVLRLLSLAMIASMTGTMLPANLQLVSAEESVVAKEETEKAAALEDGISDQWTQDNKVGEDAVCHVENGWLHLKSGTGNGNDPGTKPAMFVNANTFEFKKEGYFEFTMKSNNDNTGIDNSDRFGVYLGYDGDATGMFIGYDNVGWFWQKYGAPNNPWYSEKRVPAPAKGAEVKVHISWTADKKVTLKVDDKVAFQNEDFSGISNLGNKIGIKCGSYEKKVSDVYLKDIHYTGQKEAATYDVTGKITDADGNALEEATVTVSGRTATTNKDGNYSLKLAAGTYDMTVSKAGYQSVTQSIKVTKDGLEVKAVKLKKAAEVVTEKLSTEAMDVYVAKNFPSVVRYEMKGDLKGKVFEGQKEVLNTIRINEKDITISDKDVKATIKGNKATYEMTVKADGVDAVITAELVAEANTLAFNITNIKNNLKDTVDGQPIQTISIPNHSLVSVNSAQNSANMKAAAMSSNTVFSGDEFHKVTKDTKINRDYMYAFVSNDELSAGLWSNSEHDGRAVASVAGGGKNTRIFAKTTDKDGVVSLGLESAPWYYHRVKKALSGDSYMVKETEMPSTKVIITADQNDDKMIDWQDGAIAFRSIMNNPYKSEQVPELVSWRIAMNFGGQAQNPFLTTLDNVKRVAMHTDGLGQSVLLKGYASEGHDSGHPDYANIGERLGGAEDMNIMMEKGKDFGARFGIHVNAGEMYPEAKAFSDKLVGRHPDKSLKYGWNWIDQGIAIDSVYDLGEGLRKGRFDELKKKVGDNMDFVYVDIWGNQTGGDDDSWETRKISKEINDNGWRMANEWGAANEYDATFQHWATDLTYGGYGMKGQNSEVIRFLRNHQKDSWVGNYPSYRGAAVAPLLGGYNMKDFEGWQGRNDYDAWIVNLYSHDLTTKFIQHFKVVKWEDGKEYTDSFMDGDKKVDYKWTPEKKITLKDDKGNTLILERKSDDPNSADYHDRTMTLNGKVIGTGSEVRADQGNDVSTGTEKYLLPWNWDVNTGKPVKESDEKMYHWNTKGGDSTWDLPDSWKDLKTVVMYELTDLGKVGKVSVPVTNGKVVLKGIKAQTPYVLFRGEKANLDITWSEGMHIVDAGFNTGDAGLKEHWTKTGEGKASIAKSQYSNPMLKLDGEVSMTQELTGLNAGQRYAVLVGVDNRSDSKAAVTVKANGKVLDSNYTTRSIAKNYIKAYTHSNSSATVDGSSYFQHVYVYFTAPQSGKVTLTLSKEAGDGSAYYDDVRVTETKMDVLKKDKDGKVIGLEQDFENNVQGVYPFVLGGVENVEDNRTHLSEIHAPFTQAGWDVKQMDDVLTKNDPDSKWSVKVNGLVQRNNLIMQTIPQNFRFEPGEVYRVSFDYQQGSNGIYGVVVGDGEYKPGLPVKELPMAMGSKAERTHTFEMIGSESGQSWFGIYSTGNAPDLQGKEGAAANFGGYKEIVLDNVKIELVNDEITREQLQEKINEAKLLNQEEYDAESWKALEMAVVKARVALDKYKPDSKEVRKAYYNLKLAIESLRPALPEEQLDVYDLSVSEYKVTAGSAQPDAGGEGPAEFAQDGKAGTHWHTKWSDSNLNNAWYQFKLGKAQEVNGFRYLPRTGATNANGKLLKVKVQISKNDGKDWEDAKTSVTLSPETKWQKVVFDNPISDVTDVKIIALETAGQSDGQKNTFASAAELRLTHTEKAVVPEGEVDKTGLKSAIEAAKALKKDGYTPETWAVLEAKLVEAEAVLAKEDATDYDVLLAIANLTDAIEGLKPIETPNPGEVNKDALNSLIAQYDGLSAKDYTAESWKAFANALNNAKAVVAKENASQAEVDQAIAALKSAYAGLAKAGNTNPSKADKSKLQKFYDECVGFYKEADHSKGNWKAYQEALAAVKAVLADKDATQKEVDSALEKLINITAKMNTELKDSSNAPKNPLTGKGNIIKTGDTTSPIVWAVAGVAAVLAVVVAFFAKRRKKH